MKNIFSNSDIVVKSGPYLLMEKLCSFIEIKYLDNINGNENKGNFIDNIFINNIKRDSKELNSEYEKNIYLFINSTKIKSFLENYINESKNKSKLYPFGKYI